MNKSTPKKRCEGKCHLKKQLDKEDEKQNATSNPSKEKYEIQLFADFKTVINEIQLSTTIAHTSLYTSSEYTSHLVGVFHPPLA